MRVFLFLVLSLLFVCSAFGADIKSDLRASDSNHDGVLDHNELADYFLKHDKKIAELRKQGMGDAKVRAYADDLADDALSAIGYPKPALSIDDALYYVERKALITSKQSEIKIGWPGLGFSRTLTDDVDPRKDEIDDRPFLATYSHDSKRQNNKDFFGVLGTVTLANVKKDLSTGLLKIKPGVDVDIDSSKDATESSVDFGLNISHLWFANENFSHVLSLTPKFGTDRKFHRGVYEVSLSWSFASSCIGSGYNTWIGGQQKNPDDSLLRLYWKPTIGIEAGKVGDAAGNEELQKIKDEGVYSRLVAGAKLTLTPLILSPRLSISAAYTNRTDLGRGWNKDYWTIEADYDLAKNVQLTVLYRNGEKPSSFKKIEAVLFGIGITL